MASHSIMQEIRNLLSQGKSGTEVIALGYKPPTVYKVQRQLRRRQPHQGISPTQSMEQQPSIADTVNQEASSDEYMDFFELLFKPLGDPAQTEGPCAEREQAQARIRELEEEAGEVLILKERVHELKGKAEAAAELHQQVLELQTELKNVVQTLEALRHREAELYIQYLTAQSIAQVSQERLQASVAQAGQWRRESQALQSQLQAFAQENTKLQAEVNRLEPLKVWSGHPCTECGKPMTGSVDRKLAAKKMKDMAHVHCLK